MNSQCFGRYSMFLYEDIPPALQLDGCSPVRFQGSKISILCVSTSVYDSVYRFACPEEFSSI